MHRSLIVMNRILMLLNGFLINNVKLLLMYYFFITLENKYIYVLVFLFFLNKPIFH